MILRSGFGLLTGSRFRTRKLQMRGWKSAAAETATRRRPRNAHAASASESSKRMGQEIAFRALSEKERAGLLPAGAMPASSVRRLAGANGWQAIRWRVPLPADGALLATIDVLVAIDKMQQDVVWPIDWKPGVRGQKERAERALRIRAPKSRHRAAIAPGTRKPALDVQNEGLSSGVAPSREWKRFRIRNTGLPYGGRRGRGPRRRPALRNAHGIRGLIRPIGLNGLRPPFIGRLDDIDGRRPRHGVGIRRREPFAADPEANGERQIRRQS